MPRLISTILAGVFRFDAVVRREGVRGRRIAIPVPVVRGLLRTGWNRRASLRLAIGKVVWTTLARRMGGAVVVALPKDCVGVVGDVVAIELWQAAPVAREYVD